MSNDPAKRNEACADIESLPSGYPISVATKTAAAQRDAAALHDALHSDWSQLRAALPSLLVEIANRTAPLRDRMWQWIVLPRRPDDAHDLHRLSDTGPMPRSKVRVRGQRGISVTRLTQLTRLRMRFQSLNQALRRPFGTRFAAASFADKARIPEVAPRLLDKIDELKTQRINQTANQILAAALGLELKSPDPATQSTRLTRDIHGLYQKRTDREGRPWKPVDFIVVEDLSRYRTAQTRSRSENKRLVDWCHREAVKKLKELAEPFGLKVVEANPSYTSKFSGWTGIAGFRAEEIAPADLEAWPWNEQIEAAARSNEPTDDEKALLRCAQWLRMLNVGRPREKHLRLVVPRDGGSRFVPAWPEPGEPERDPTRHADVGAAHNVGLRAIGALTEATIHPYVSSKSGRQSKKKANAPIDGRFFEVSGQAADAHTLPGDPFPSIPRSKFDEVVGRQKWPRCEAINRQRMRRWHLKFGTPLPEDEDEISV
jgi:IS605 OrfB family transposase